MQVQRFEFMEMALQMLPAQTRECVMLDSLKQRLGIQGIRTVGFPELGPLFYTPCARRKENEVQFPNMGPFGPRWQE